ncbi:uncharacterized protein TRIADDRAFT_52188 [Trichoplax adhaerens]|uniref:Uncharacterized protein n=1 Tax=Trichoplax adhaerens TaxID=10228 RepID=B3RM05_TRIAD|nr:predicted protein [Trichoplax adhaerens]EDV28878.1 predicted protein [Trichoplax adhaerens]|eukprot:XP_002108080.1 predicted protein [Trichoplax adhaerens]
MPYSSRDGDRPQWNGRDVDRRSDYSREDDRPPRYNKFASENRFNDRDNFRPRRPGMPSNNGRPMRGRNGNDRRFDPRSQRGGRRQDGNGRPRDARPREYYVNRFVIFCNAADPDEKLSVIPYEGNHNEVYDNQDKVYIHEPAFDRKLNYADLMAALSYCMKRTVQTYKADRHGELFFIARYGKIFYTNVNQDRDRSKWTVASFMNSVNTHNWPFAQELETKSEANQPDIRHSFYPVNENVQPSDFERALERKKFQKIDTTEEYYVSYVLEDKERDKRRNVFICYDQHLKFKRIRVPTIKWCDIDISRDDNVDLRISFRSERVLERRDLNMDDRLVQSLKEIPLMDLITFDKKNNLQVLQDRENVQLVRHKITHAYIITREFCQSRNLEPFWHYLTVNCTEVTEYSRLDKNIGAFKTVESKCEITATVDHVGKLKIHKEDKLAEVVKAMLKFWGQQLPATFKN